MKRSSVLLLFLASLFVLAPSCKPVGAGSAPVHAGGVYVLDDSHGRVVYVGQSRNLVKRLGEWKTKLPALSGRVVLRSSDVRVRMGAEQILYERYTAEARAGGWDLLNVRSPLNMKAPATLPEHSQYVNLAREYLQKHALQSFDPLDYTGRG